MHLLGLWKSGDESAFEALYRKYVVPLVEMALHKVHDKSVAKDLVQDLMIHLYLQKEALDIHTNFKAYLHTALRNRVFNYKRQQLSMFPLEEWQPETGTENVTEYIHQKELEDKLRIAIQQLPLQCRNVFVLSREHQLSNKEIAEKLGISVNTVEQHMRKALRIMRTHFDYKMAWLVVGVGELLRYMVM